MARKPVKSHTLHFIKEKKKKRKSVFSQEGEGEDRHFRKSLARRGTLTDASHFLIFMSREKETKVSTNVLSKYVLHLSLKCVPGKSVLNA